MSYEPGRASVVIAVAGAGRRAELVSGHLGAGHDVVAIVPAGEGGLADLTGGAGWPAGAGRLAVFVGDPADEVDRAGAVEMAAELFGGDGPPGVVTSQPGGP